MDPLFRDGLDLGVVLQDRYGQWAGKLFLLGFWAAAMSSLVGVWNGVSLMFADFMTHVTDGEAADARAGGRWYRAYILWLTFPPMVMMFLGKPVWLILAYGVLGAFFMPFLAVTLLILLNRKGAGKEAPLNEPDPSIAAEVDPRAATDGVVPPEWRNGWLSNGLMLLCAVLFVALAVNEIKKVLAPYVGWW